MTDVRSARPRLDRSARPRLDRSARPRLDRTARPRLDRSGPKLEIRLVRSTIGRPYVQRQTALALGLRRIGDRVVMPASAPVRGMVEKLKHLLSVREIDA